MNSWIGSGAFQINSHLVNSIQNSVLTLERGAVHVNRGAVENLTCFDRTLSQPGRFGRPELRSLGI